MPPVDRNRVAITIWSSVTAFILAGMLTYLSFKVFGTGFWSGLVFLILLFCLVTSLQSLVLHRSTIWDKCKKAAGGNRTTGIPGQVQVRTGSFLFRSSNPGRVTEVEHTTTTEDENGHVTRRVTEVWEETNVTSATIYRIQLNSSPGTHINQQNLHGIPGQMQGVTQDAQIDITDLPPSYEDVIKAQQPPPAYSETNR